MPEEQSYLLEHSQTCCHVFVATIGRSVWTVNTDYTFTLQDLQSEGLGSYLLVSHWNNNDTSVCSVTSSYGSLIILETLNFYVPWHVHCVIRPGTTAMQKYFFTLEKGFVTLAINVSPEWLLLKNTTVLWFSKGSIPKTDQGIVLTHR